MKKVITIIIFICTIFSTIIAQDNASMKLPEALANYSLNFHKSKVFIKIDKDIYAPSEKVWFKAEVVNCLTEKLVSNENLIVLIKAESGEVIVDNNYKCINGVVSGQITIPNWVSNREAFIIAYTSKALNTGEASLAAIKPITIKKPDHNNSMVSTSLDQNFYKKGSEISLKVLPKSISSLAKKEKLTVSIYDYQKKINTIKINAIIGETNEIKFKLPNHVNDGLYFKIESPGKHNISIKKPIHTNADNIKIEFFPEGGNMLFNNIQRIVYRAIDPFGKPVEINGLVFDLMGNQVGVGKNLKNGIGLINLMPMPNQAYKFKITSDYGKGQSLDIPLAILNGCSISLIKTEDFTLKMALNNTGSIIGQKITLMAISKGEVNIQFDVTAQTKNNFQIESKDLPLGINIFVATDEKGKILSKRLLYNIPNKDINIDIVTKLKRTKSNGDVDVSVDLNNFINSFGIKNVDIKITDIHNLYKTPVIQSYNLLEYPLKTPAPKTVLDIFFTNIELIANRYKYFSLQEIINGDNLENEKSINNFKGTVTNKKGDKIKGATVMVKHPKNPTLIKTITDENGRFEFTDLIKSNEMVIKAINGSMRKKYYIHLDRSFDETLEELILFETFNSKKHNGFEDYSDYYKNNKSLLLLAGNKNRIKKSKEKSDLEKRLQSGTSILEVIRIIKQFYINDNQIFFQGTTSSLQNQQGAIIIIDGQKMGTSIDVLQNIDPYNVASVNVSTNPANIEKYTKLNSIGIIEVTTKKTSDKTRKVIDEIYFDNFQQSNFSSSEWKYQSTIYWEPNAKVNEDGMIFLKLKLSELQTDFVIQIDAKSPDGITHQQFTTFSSKNNNN